MSNLIESLQMCMWFDVNIISRRNLMSAVASSILVNILKFNLKNLLQMIHRNFLRFFFVSTFSFSVHGG